MRPSSEMDNSFRPWPDLELNVPGLDQQLGTSANSQPAWPVRPAANSGADRDTRRLEVASSNRPGLTRYSLLIMICSRLDRVEMTIQRFGNTLDESRGSTNRIFEKLEQLWEKLEKSSELIEAIRRGMSRFQQALASYFGQDGGNEVGSMFDVS